MKSLDSKKINFFEKKRNELLVSIIKKNTEDTKFIIKTICKKAKKTDLAETEQKAINQVFQIVKCFRDNLVNNGLSSYTDLKRHLKKIIAELAVSQINNPETISYSEFREKLSLTENRYKQMLKNVISFQITTGCSNYCRRCNEWALPGTRKHFTFEAVKKILDDLYKSGNADFALYSASDPLDWKDGDRTITDILHFLKQGGIKLNFGLLTKIPPGSENILKKLAEDNADFAVSITEKNRKKAKRLERLTGKKFIIQHDTDNLLIPSGLDEDFSTIKSSITDNYGVELTAEGAFIIIPTFTCALTPTGQCRISVLPDTSVFIKKLTGRRALSQDFFLPLTATDSFNNVFKLQRLLKPQIENIMLCNGHENITPPGMMNLKEYFKSHEKDAVLNRKKIFPAVVNTMKKNSGDLFKENLKNYTKLCSLDGVNEIKINIFFKFLTYISKYLKNYPDESEIIKFLRHNEKQQYLNFYNKHIAAPEIEIKTAISSKDSGLFELFESIMFKLMENPMDGRINRFINTKNYDVVMH